VLGDIFLRKGWDELGGVADDEGCDNVCDNEGCDIGVEDCDEESRGGDVERRDGDAERRDGEIELEVNLGGET